MASRHHHCAVMSKDAGGDDREEVMTPEVNRAAEIIGFDLRKSHFQK